MDVVRKQIQGMFGEGYTPPSTHRSVAPSSVVSFHGSEPWEEHEEVDLIALQTTPDEFQQATFDVGKFELQTVSANCTPEAIDELKELRLRQLHVRTPLFLPGMHIGCLWACRLCTGTVFRSATVLDSLVISAKLSL